MKIKVQPRTDGVPGWKTDITVVYQGETIRERKNSPFTSKVATREAAETRALELAKNGKQKAPAAIATIPTLAEAEERFVEEYSKGKQQAHSTIVKKRSVFKNHLVPALGTKRLDEITTGDVDALVSSLTKRGLEAKTINDVLSILRTTLDVAAKRWNVMPPTRAAIDGLKVPENEMTFYDAGELARLLEHAKFVHDRVELVVLLGADAGLRAGEMIALEWGDVDLVAGILTIRRKEWRGVVGTTKSKKPRKVEITSRLARALKAFKHLRGPRVFYRDTAPLPGRHTDDGKKLRGVSLKIIENWIAAALRLAGFSKDAAVHALRHTFGTRLAARGASAMQIKELMGHSSLKATEKYLHFSPGARGGAMRLLEEGQPEFPGSRLAIVPTEGAVQAKAPQ